MHTGEFLTRGTIWITIVVYTFGTGVFAWSRKNLMPGTAYRRDAATRLAWTIACASLIVHFIVAFQFYHCWSHQAAYRETARQTAELFGFSWGGGLFINYALLIIWLVDLGWWWLNGLDSYRRRPRWLLALWHGLLIFIIFNATFVFKDGVVRWLGLGICASLSLMWLLILTREQLHPGDFRDG